MAAMLITIFLGPKFIEFLRDREFGQQIREEGPAEHQTKAGTPTMGGLIVFVAIAVPYLVLSPLDTKSLAVFGVALGAAGLGFADDFIKVTKRRSLGLSARWKLIAQIALAVGLWWVANEEVGLDPSLQVRISDAEIYLGPVLYVIVVFLVIAGASNAVNLTDGLDGLAAGSCAIVLLAYTAITITSGQEGLALLSACLVGASVGFLWFNSFPATIFMGDTGSLGLGAAIGALAVMTQTELLLIILGGIFVIEALSVAVQVLSFKLFRRRVLLMAPVHHHFEMMAWSETKIMLRFWIVAAVCAGIGYTLYQNSIPSVEAAPAPPGRPLPRRGPGPLGTGRGASAVRAWGGGRGQRRRLPRGGGAARPGGPGDSPGHRGSRAARTGTLRSQEPGSAARGPGDRASARAWPRRCGGAGACLAPFAEPVRRRHRDERQDDGDRATRSPVADGCRARGGGGERRSAAGCAGR